MKKFMLLLIPVMLLLGCSQDTIVEDHRKGSSATLVYPGTTISNLGL